MNHMEYISVPMRQNVRNAVCETHSFVKIECDACIMTVLPVPHLSTETFNRAFYKQDLVSVVVVSVSLTLSVLSSASPFLSVLTLPDPQLRSA